MDHPGQKRSLGPALSPKVRRRYEQMMVEDMGPWTEFLRSDSMPLLQVWYNVHVGQAVEVPDGSPEYMKAHAAAVSRKRIDAVGRTANEIWIIEVKPYATMYAIGQVIVYEVLFRREFEMNMPSRKVIVAASSDPDILEAAAKYEVKLVNVGGVDF
ncbi:hypothetical protein LCGC14_1088790 [marine sediment metagenome]|uniref:Uncharacterized protein n=1 Tax=marine sediment metagenome TaxID=412755 RepID=A0A0F9QJ30_9ZZZZ